MRKSRSSIEQIMAILQEHAAGAAPAELMRRHNVSRQTFYAWKKCYGDLQVSDAKRLKALEDENALLGQERRDHRPERVIDEGSHAL